MIDVAVGRIHVLLIDSLGARIEQSAAETDGLSAYADPRKDDATGKTVDQFTPFGLVAKTRLYKKILIVAF